MIYSRLIESQNSIFLTKNQVTFELQFQNQNQRDKWIKALQNVCVLTDFHQKYQKQRLMRKSSTAMVLLFLKTLYPNFTRFTTFNQKLISSPLWQRFSTKKSLVY